MTIVLYICNDVANMQKIIKKYNKCFGAILLALYLFIATPISFWHNHLNANEDNISQTISKLIFKKAAEKGFDSICGICTSSHYSVFYNNDLTYLIRPLALYQVANDIPLIKLPFKNGLTAENKGPPLFV